MYCSKQILYHLGFSASRLGLHAWVRVIGVPHHLMSIQNAVRGKAVAHHRCYAVPMCSAWKVLAADCRSQ